MTSDELNDAIARLEDGEPIGAPELTGSGKVVPYVGWFWRTVDFDARITLALCEEWAGFCEKNKWGYDEALLSVEASARVRAACETFVTTPAKESAAEVYATIQREWTADFSKRVRP